MYLLQPYDEWFYVLRDSKTPSSKMSAVIGDIHNYSLEAHPNPILSATSRMATIENIHQEVVAWPNFSPSIVF